MQKKRTSPKTAEKKLAARKPPGRSVAAESATSQKAAELETACKKSNGMETECKKFKVIKAIRTESDQTKGTRVIFELNGRHVPKVFSIGGKEPRVICDFMDVRLGDVKHLIPIDDGNIRQVRVGLHISPEPKVRSVIDLVKGRDYKVNQIFFEKEHYFVIHVTPILEGADSQ